MFRKINSVVIIHRKSVREVPHWITDKKAVTNNNTQLPDEFDILHLYTPNDLELYYLNKYKWWK